MPEGPLILIVMATKLEAQPFLEALGVEEVARVPVPVYRRDRIIVAISGIGKGNTAIATTFCCAEFHPDVVLNLGAAGTTGEQYRCGDILHVTKVVEYDRPGIRTGRPHVHTPDVLAGFREASLATQDRPVVDAGHRAEVAAEAELVDMEGAAVVHAAKRFGIKCYLFKFVSDTPEDSGHDDIISEIKRLREPFCSFVVESVLPVLG